MSVWVMPSVDVTKIFLSSRRRSQAVGTPKEAIGYACNAEAGSVAISQAQKAKYR